MEKQFDKPTANRLYSVRQPDHSYESRDQAWFRLVGTHYASWEFAAYLIREDLAMGILQIVTLSSLQSSTLAFCYLVEGGQSYCFEKNDLKNNFL